MLRTARFRLVLAVVAATGVALALPGSAWAHTAQPRQTSAGPADGTTYLVAALNGRNEVPGPAGSPTVGDRDGRAVEVVRIKGDQLSFAVRWSGIGAPTAGHIHLGAAGVNGPVAVPLFGTKLPDTLSAAVGTVTVADPSVLDSLRTDPGRFYANLHDARFPGGAVRGQLHKVTHPVDLDAVLRGGPLAAILDGGQEVPTPGKRSGDPDGHAAAFVHAGADDVTFALSWSGIAPPTDGHLHQGGVGANGPVAVNLFAAPGGLPESLTGVAGAVDDVRHDLVRRIGDDPTGFYVNLHTTEFPGGAVRGQLFRTGAGAPAYPVATFVTPVVRGMQIYACTRQSAGTYAYTQHNVRARLAGGITHSYVTDDAGPPRWAARDGSAVTGAVLARTPNGAGNIPELDLAATRTGAATGRLAGAVEIERLNTVGGVAPAGACDPVKHPVVAVPYEADYVFLA